MNRVLVTGAFGNVGRSVLAALRDLGAEATAFEYPSRANRALARRLGIAGATRWGDVRDGAAVAEAARDADAVIHLAAIIPPAADLSPEFARTVNVGGTAAVVAAAAASPKRPRLVFSSSVAAYGDRVKDYFIRVDDPLRPCEDDQYARHKVEAEGIVRGSGLRWVICRLSYIVWRKKLAMDPLMFRMPLATRLEVCHTRDTGLALARAALCPEAEGGTFNIAGGERCRTDYRTYLDRMLSAFGLGGLRFLPEEAFSQAGYHCGYMDTEESERLFRYQRLGLDDYYAEVAEEARGLRFWAALARPAVTAAIRRRSRYLRAFLARAGRGALHYAGAAGS